MKTVTLAKTVIKKKMEAGTAHQNVLKNVETDAQIVLNVIWPWILAWNLVTLDGVKKTAWNANNVIPKKMELWTAHQNAIPTVETDVWTV